MRFFVDTNILVYRLDAEAKEKQVRANAVLDRLWRERSGRTSFQVLHEYYSVATRKLRLEPEQIRSSVRDLLAWHPVLHDAVVLERAWRHQDRYGMSFWDAAVIAAAQAAECTHLLTEDLQDHQNFEGLLVVNPFMPAAATLV